jgi:hypothetical protein
MWFGVGYHVPMLDDARVRELARKIARDNLGAKRVEDVLSEPANDSLGNGAVAFTVVLRPSAVRQLKGGKEIVRMLMALQEAFDKAGDERTPMVRWATTEDLASGDPES